MPARKHFLKGTRLYGKWRNMIYRCESKKYHAFHRYGGRGIRVCEQWRHDVLQFEKDMGHPPPGHVLDRINNDGNYEPGNCRWVSQKKNCNNRSGLVFITYKGKKKTIAEWSEITGIHRETLQRRRRFGDSGKRLFRKPKPITKGKNIKNFLVIDGEKIALKDAALKYRITYQTIHWRIKKMGMSHKEAVTRKSYGAKNE